ncbi:MAG: hypothetical protein QOI12_4586 [Alphaproteobacteria bacterium]|jgi:hypothetical protein|nr:hypothetical protein [Alphaproteobacteria bacterium]
MRSRESTGSRMIGTAPFPELCMSSPRQGDLFGQDGADPSDEDFETPVYYPDPAQVRAELHRILAEARAAQTLPWDQRDLLLYRTIFPQMSNALPEQEAAQLRFEFMEELKRLKAA